MKEYIVLVDIVRGTEWGCAENVVLLRIVPSLCENMRHKRIGRKRNNDADNIEQNSSGIVLHDLFK